MRPTTDQGMVATTCIARIAKPLFKMIDRPWKVSRSRCLLPVSDVVVIQMYPIGFVFGSVVLPVHLALKLTLFLALDSTLHPRCE